MLTRLPCQMLTRLPCQMLEWINNDIFSLLSSVTFISTVPSKLRETHLYKQCHTLFQINNATPYFKFFLWTPTTHFSHPLHSFCVRVGVMCKEYNIMVIYCFWDFMCRFCWSCKAACAYPCWWDTVLEKWPIIIFICDVLKGSPELSVSLAFLQLLLLESFHNHCAVNLLILGPGLVVCCSWWLFLYSDLFHSQADLLCCCCLWF